MHPTQLAVGGDVHPPPFLVQVHQAADGIVRVAPSGELDLFGGPTLAEALRLAQAEATLVVLDLRDLTFFETAGLQVVVDADARARRAGGQLVIVPGPPSVQQTFALTGADRRLRFVEPSRRTAYSAAG